MPRPRKKPEPEKQQEAPQNNDDAFAQSERESVMALMQELSGVSSARVTVYRATPNKPQAYMFSCSPEAFSLDDLRDKYNGGDFRLYISREGKVWRNMKISVEPRESSPPDVSPLTDVVIAMREGFERQAEILRAALEKQRPAPADSFVSRIDVNAIIQSLPSLIAAFRGAVAPPANGGEDRAIDMLLKGIELARDLAPGDDGLVTVLRDLVKSPMLAAAVHAMQTAQQSQPAHAAAPARVSTPAPSPIAMAAAKQQKDDAMKNPLDRASAYLAFLVQRAEAGADPTLYAELILDNISDAELSLLLSLPDPISLLAQHDPRVNNHRAFFESVLATLREAASGSDAVDTTASAMVKGG